MKLEPYMLGNKTKNMWLDSFGVDPLLEDSDLGLHFLHRTGSATRGLPTPLCFRLLNVHRLGR
jgi:hypothetical protein